MKFKNVQQIATSCKTVGIVIRKMNKEILKKINNNTNTIEFTLYSINQSTQNILSNDKNSFSEIFNLLDYISVKHPNVRVTLNLPIFKNNIKEIMPTIGWIINFDFALIKILNPNNPKLQNKDKIELKLLFDYLIKTNTEFPNLFIQDEKKLNELFIKYNDTIIS